MCLARTWLARSLLFFLVALAALPLTAQQERCQELNSQVAALEQQGKYAQAIPIAQEALRVAEASCGADARTLAAALNNLAALYDDLGRYVEAEPLYRRALRLREEALGAEHPAVAISLNNLALLYQEEGKYTQAEPLFQRALRIDEKTLGPEDRELATVLNNLAALYTLQDRYSEAEPLYERALKIDIKALGPGPQVASDLSNLAMVYKGQGKYGPAAILFQRALAMAESSLGPEDPLLATFSNNLAELYREQGRYGEAQPLYERALRIREKVLGPEHPLLAGSLLNLAELYREQGKYAEAEPLLLRALPIMEKSLGPEHPNLAALLTCMALLYQGQGEYARAQPLLQRALLIQEKALGPEHSMVGNSLSNVAEVRFAQGLPQQAQPYFARAFDNLLRQFQYHFTYMSEKERLAFLATVSYRFPVYFSFVHQFRKDQPELAGRMYDLLLWQKGLIVGSVASLRRQVEASGDAEALQLLDQLAAQRAQLAALLNVPSQDREARRKQLEDLGDAAYDLERKMVARSAAFAEQKKLERVTWQQVRDALRPGEAAVEFARFRFYDGKQWTDTTYYVALVVTPETRDHPAYVVLGEGKELEGAPLVQFQQGVQVRGMEGAPEAGEAAAPPAAQAYELLWKPLQPLLAGRERLYLAPDGVLNQMPLGLIVTPQGKLLMEQYDLRLVSSTKDLLRQAPAPAAATAVLIGNPAFDLNESQQRAAVAELGAAPRKEPVPMAPPAPGGRSRDQGAGASLPPLPGTGAEVQAIAQLLQQRQWQAASYTADRALEEAVKQVRSPRLLHLATHGFFLADQQIKSGRSSVAGGPSPGLEDPMLRSGLFFAGADRALAGQTVPGDLDDGVLTAYEARSLNLQGTELVVLSACNTGQGKVQNGEGVFGLRRALQEAGAQAVLMSLWSVPDKETQELMALFYGKWLSGTEKHEALRQAQREMREKVRQRYGRDLPYYWGAFVLVGR